MSDNQAETALAGVVVTGEAKEALDLSWVSELACGHKVPTEFAQSVVRCPACGTDVRCKQAERINLAEVLDHHQRGYLYTRKLLAELAPALIAEVERLRAQRDEALALELEACKELSEEARFTHRAQPGWFTNAPRECRVCHMPSPCVPFRIAAALDSAVAHIGRLEAKQADVERIVNSVNQLYPVSQASLHDALRDLSRVLSRTEDGANG